MLIRVKASSINYRDLKTIEDPVSRGLPFPTVPNSDAGGEAAAVGAFKVGDRVTSCFFEDRVDGDITENAMNSALGGARPGVLAEYVVLDQLGVGHAPAHLSDLQAATLPCAALTAWHALTGPAPVLPGETVLLLSIGGVSVFAQQFSNLFGAEAVAISPENANLVRLLSLGAKHSINYRQTLDWGRLVKDLTGGPGTLERSINAVGIGGRIQLWRADRRGRHHRPDAADAQAGLSERHLCRLAGHVRRDEPRDRDAPSRARRLRGLPLLKKAKSAYHRMRAAIHFSKLVISLNT